MDKVTQLWIRACKSENSYKRLHSVYRRFYIKTDERKATVQIIITLSDIVDKYCYINTARLLNDILGYGFTKDLPLEKRTLYALVDKICSTKKARFEGLTPPCWIKNKYKGVRLDV